MRELGTTEFHANGPALPMKFDFTEDTHDTVCNNACPNLLQSVIATVGIYMYFGFLEIVQKFTPLNETCATKTCLLGMT